MLYFPSENSFLLLIKRVCKMKNRTSDKKTRKNKCERQLSKASPKNKMKSTSTISKLETGAICIYYVLLFLLSPQMWQSKRHLHIRFNNENQQSSKLFVRSLPLLVLLLLTLNLRYCFLKLKSANLPVFMQRYNVIIILCLTNFLENKL